MENISSYLLLVAFAGIALVCLYFMRKKKPYWIILGEENNPYVQKYPYKPHDAVIAEKGGLQIIQENFPEKCFPPKEFGINKGTKYQKIRSCHSKK